PVWAPGYHASVLVRSWAGLAFGDLAPRSRAATALQRNGYRPTRRKSRYRTSGAVPFQSAHRPEPGFQPSVICLDRVVRVLPDGLHRRGDQLVEDPRVG